MKSSSFVLMAMRTAMLVVGLWSTSAMAHTPNRAEASAEVNQCVVRASYGLPVDGDIAQQQAMVVNQCVNFTQGIGAWYLRESIRTGTPQDPQGPQAQHFLQSYRALTQVYLQLALYQCAQAHATQEQCLALLYPSHGHNP